MPSIHAITPETLKSYANLFAVAYTKEEFFISFANASPADNLQSDTIVAAVVKLVMHPTHAAAFAESLAAYVEAYKANFAEPEPETPENLPAGEKPPHISTLPSLPEIDNTLPEPAPPTEEAEPERPLIPSTLPDLNPPGIDKPPALGNIGKPPDIGIKPPDLKPPAKPIIDRPQPKRKPAPPPPVAPGKRPRPR